VERETDRKSRAGRAKSLQAREEEENRKKTPNAPTGETPNDGPPPAARAHPQDSGFKDALALAPSLLFSFF